MSDDCELSQILLRKFGYLEKRVTYLEGKSRRQQDLIEKLRRKLRKLKKTTRNKDKLSQNGPGANPDPELIEKIESRQNELLKPVIKDEKMGQNLVIRMGEKPFFCSVCSKTFSQAASLKRHMRVHTGEKPFSCSVCSKPFSDAANLKRHNMRIHIGKLSQEKPVANPNPNLELIEEIESRQNEPLKPVKKVSQISKKLIIRMGVRCDEKSQRILNPVEKRVENGHTSKKSQIKTFNGLQKDAKIVEILSKPKGSVKKSQICNFCSKSFQGFANLSNHMRVHTGERPFKCEICSKSFKVTGHLKIHSRTHTGEKPFSCSVCSKPFSEAGNLRRHMRVHTGEKPYSCSICFKKFSENHSMKTHERIHVRKIST